MDHFEKIIKECREKRSDRVVNNAAIDHARIALENILEVAAEDEQPVRIVSGELNNTFYENLVGSMKKVIDKSLPVELIILDPAVDIENNKFAQAVLNGQGTVRRATEKINTAHFTLVGDKIFRVETDHHQAKAAICFNNELVGKCLLSEFEKLSNSVPKYTPGH